MIVGSQELAVLRIELWHGFLLLALMVLLVPMRILEPRDLLIGGLFMGLNFFLLSCGIRWVLTPFAAKGRARTGIFLLVLKFVLFLGSASALFLQVKMDAPSFAVGVTCLLIAIVVDGLWAYRHVGG